jgi:hypothetical protein
MLLQSTMDAVGLAPSVAPLMVDAPRRRRMAEVARTRGHPDAARDIVSLFLTLLAS